MATTSICVSLVVSSTCSAALTISSSWLSFVAADTLETWARAVVMLASDVSLPAAATVVCNRVRKALVAVFVELSAELVAAVAVFMTLSVCCKVF